jgi:hypothetical protein
MDVVDPDRSQDLVIFYCAREPSEVLVQQPDLVVDASNYLLQGRPSHAPAVEVFPTSDRHLM